MVRAHLQSGLVGVHIIWMVGGPPQLDLFPIDRLEWTTDYF